MPKNKHFKRDYLILFAASLAIIGLSYYFREELSALKSLGLLGIFIINIIGSATVFLPAPGIATVVAGGFLYNPLFVAIIAGVGSAIGDMVGYLDTPERKSFLRKTHSGTKFLNKLFIGSEQDL